MLRQLAVILTWVSVSLVYGQTPSPKYQLGTITAVTSHQSAPNEAASDLVRYDVSVKIGNTVFVVLYTPPHGANSVEYSTGMNKLFAVGTDILTFNSRLSGTTEVPILRRETLPAESGLDWSKAQSQYFSMKQQHLSEALGLSDDQQSKIKPTFEQEAGEAGQVLWNPALSRKDKLKSYEKIVASSDAKLKPFLSPTQVNKLLDLRKQQKQDVKELLAKQKAGDHN